MLSKLSYLNSNIALTMGYLNPALNNSALAYKLGPTEKKNDCILRVSLCSSKRD